MRRFCTTIVLVLATLLSISVCSAQQTATTSVPNLIRYSGTLKDAQGAALSSSTAVGVTFSIYKQQDGGAAVWMETQNVTPDANGQYNVILGSTTATGLPDDLFLQQEQRWLGVQVQEEAEQARVLLVSVPYAFKAHEAEMLGGLPPSSFVKVPPSDASGGTLANGGSGTAGKDTTAIAASQSNASTVAQDGSWAREGTTVRLSNEADSVGIGTGTPKTKLDVSGGIHASGSISSGNSITLNGSTNSITVDSVVPFGGLANQMYIGGDNPSPPIPFSKIQVSIGTKDPTIITGHKLTIFDFSNPSLGISARPTGAGTPPGDLELAIASCVGCYSNFAVSGDAVLRVPGGGPLGSGNRNLILTNRDSNNGGIRFGTGQACGGGNPCETEKMTLLHNGNFGIGSNNPPTTFGVGDFLNPVDRTNPPFQMDKFGDMVRIRNVGTYHWPTALGTSGVPSVLTDLLGNGNLTWSPSTGGGGNVVGPPSPCPANYLTKWAGLYTTDCTHEYELPSAPFYLGVNVGASPAAALDVNGQSNSGINTTNTRNSYMVGYDPVLSVYPTNTSANLFVGVGAGPTTSATHNTFAGYNSGFTNVNGDYNAFFGDHSGELYNAGEFNTMVGSYAGHIFANGSLNTFLGYIAGGSFGAGANYNTCLGSQSCNNVQSGQYNIMVGFSVGPPTAGAANNQIRIGTQNLQTATYIAGIAAMPPGANASDVCVDNLTGQLYKTPISAPCVPSSRRFKDQIADMGDRTNRLWQLRPVTFYYKPQNEDGSHLLQYGLIAEEVAKVYPEMVAYEKDGTPYTVRYQLLAPMLLNELQKQHKVVAAQQDELQTQLQQIKTQQQQMQAQRQEIDGLKLQLQQQNASLQERLSKLESYVATQIKVASDNPRQTTPVANGGSQ